MKENGVKRMTNKELELRGAIGYCIALSESLNPDFAEKLNLTF